MEYICSLVLIYVNLVRHEMLSKGTESRDIPITKDALILHRRWVDIDIDE